ncbi:MAG TPA: sugar phosphate nucleotidyltransferase [Candidatus Sulfotelmatobacter sp.]|nr:sugar phosphate nucleotidyltransferase [Candidatus Sulfotelmatobacter sp.]
MALHVLVLAGGSGTRLWPLSREAQPKHLLPLGPGGTTLLRSTVERVLGLGAVHLVTTASQAVACRRELEGLVLGEEAFIVEPAARGTGPAIALAVISIAREDPEAIVCSVHADHYVADTEAYNASVCAAAGWSVVSDSFAAVGITPGYPAPGFGYIALGEQRRAEDWAPPVGDQAAEVSSRAAALPAHDALRFVEKPALELAESFVAGGRHLWNCGLFAWPARVFRRELAACASTLLARIDEVADLRHGGDEARAAAAYAALDPIPIEPLLLERGAPLTAVSANFGWADLGSWPDLYAARRELEASDERGNVVEGDCMIAGARDSIVLSRGERFVCLVGGEKLIVVDTGDAVLVARADEAQAVRDVVARLRAAGRRELL